MPPRLPRHVAIIMDGNGRWAEARGLPRSEGHRAGAESVRDIVRAARQVGIRALTLYAFSSQNWERPFDEVQALMHLLRDYLIEERPEIMDNEIRLRAIGAVDRLPDEVRAPLDALVADSAGNDKMTLTLALSYGGRESIVEAAQALVRDGVAADDVSEEMFGARLESADLPPLDLLIRTSGEQRLSNFLLWEAAYAELYFDDTSWPDYRRPQLYKALEEYARRERRFGLTGAQVDPAPNDDD
jgi:undecaprenyl diphosphate synthase